MGVEYAIKNDAFGKLIDEANKTLGKADHDLERARKKIEVDRQLMMQRLHQHPTLLHTPKSSGHDSCLMRSSIGRATGLGAPLPNECLVQLALNANLVADDPKEMLSLKESIAEHVANAVNAGKDQIRVLGFESRQDMAPYAVLHLALKSPDAGKEMLRQWSNSSSLLRNGEFARKIEGVMMAECKEGLSTRDCPRKQALSPFIVRKLTKSSTSLPAEMLGTQFHSASSCEIIRGLSQQLENAPRELSKEQQKANEVENDTIKQYRDSITALQTEAANRSSYLSIELPKQEEAFQHMHTQLQETLREVEHHKTEKLHIQREHGELQSKLSALQVELDVISKSRHDEWHQRRAENALRDQQIVMLSERFDLEFKDVVSEKTEKLEKENRAELRNGPLSSKERHCVMDLETELLEARTSLHNAKSEFARLRSRLQIAEEASKMFARRLNCASHSG